MLYISNNPSFLLNIIMSLCNLVIQYGIQVYLNNFIKVINLIDS